MITKESGRRRFSFVWVYLTILSPTLFQCRDAPAGTGERENDEKTVDDRTVKFSPCCLEDGMVPSVVFVLRALRAHSSTAHKTCALFAQVSMGRGSQLLA